MDEKNINIDDVKITLPKDDNEDDVRFSLPLSKSLNKKVIAEAKKYGLTKTAYIRLVLTQIVERSEEK